MTTKQKLEQACIEHCNPQSLLRLLEEEDKEIALKLKAATPETFQKVQGQSVMIDRYIQILTKVIS